MLPSFNCDATIITAAEDPVPGRYPTDNGCRYSPRRSGASVRQEISADTVHKVFACCRVRLASGVAVVKTLRLPLRPVAAVHVSPMVCAGPMC
ncbi:hypothetical protein CSUI_006458 [Cystoisospora suis]|uniref:Uncharacterized protein n=1 Tax=Cystoisospora suis TaxID=483139 RepID=A0A2C6KU25_9APIC|nr:hypothetical protein CSUI_006458 [Cystoisospora suis]